MYAELEKSKGYKIICDWLAGNEKQPFLFQQQAWQHIINAESGLVNAPTGCGKTFSVFLGSLIGFINQHPADYKTKKNSGLQLLWITPLRALAKDIGRVGDDLLAGRGHAGRIGQCQVVLVDHLLGRGNGQLAGYRKLVVLERGLAQFGGLVLVLGHGAVLRNALRGAGRQF